MCASRRGAVDVRVERVPDSAAMTQHGPAGHRPDHRRDALRRALAEFQTVVGRLESGGLALEDSIELYERGVALHAHCAQSLTSAELRVQRLVDGAGGRLQELDLRPEDDT